MILYNASSSYYSMIGRYALLQAEVDFESRRMDIHLAKEQLSDWYIKLNPAMTVPTLVNNETIYTDSRDILKFAATCADKKWMDADRDCSLKIEDIVQAHYSISIERLTFGKALSSIFFLKFIIPKMLGKIIKNLELKKTTSNNPAAVDAKIQLNKQRLAYFTEGNLKDKLEIERQNIRQYLQQLPTPQTFLFGDKPSSADIVTVVLLGRLQMIKEFKLVESVDLQNWFMRMQSQIEYKKADIWTYFQPWRIVLKR